MAYAIAGKASSATPQPLPSGPPRPLCLPRASPCQPGEVQRDGNFSLAWMTGRCLRVDEVVFNRDSSGRNEVAIRAHSSRHNAVLDEDFVSRSMPVLVTVTTCLQRPCRRKVGNATVTSDIHHCSGMYHRPSIVADAGLAKPAAFKAPSRRAAEMNVRHASELDNTVHGRINHDERRRDRL